MNGRILLSACFALTAILTGCTGKSQQAPVQPTFTPAPNSNLSRPAAGAPANPVVAAGCLRGLTSYRFSGSFSVRPVAGAASATAAPTSDSQGITGSLANLLSRVSFQGAAMAPDRYQAMINFGGNGVQGLEVVRIGDQTFSKFSDGPWQKTDQTQGFGGVSRFDPQSLCETLLLALDAGGQTPAHETVNGMPSLRYEVSGAPLARALGGGGAPAGRSGTPVAGVQQGQVTIWRAEQGGFPVRFELTGSLEAGTIDLLMNVSDVNGKDIQINAPG